MLGAAAVPLVETHHVPPRCPGLVRDAAHVMRETRTLEAVQEQERRMILWPFVPVAVREDTGALGHVEVALGGGRETGKPSSPRPCIERLTMATWKPGSKRGGLEGHA